jgi:hypothetical protein
VRNVCPIAAKLRCCSSDHCPTSAMSPLIDLDFVMDLIDGQALSGLIPKDYCTGDGKTGTQRRKAWAQRLRRAPTHLPI